MQFTYLKTFSKPYDVFMSSGSPSKGFISSDFIRADEVLSEKMNARALELETQYGNGSLFSLLSAVGVAGPFEVLSPWEHQDSSGHRSINAAGYSALPFGDNYPPLLEFMREFLAKNRQVSLPQQSVTAWRGALEANLIRLLAREAPSHASSRVFFSNSGTEAVEGAVKFAQAAKPKARHLIHFKRAYHGKTLLALSLTPNPSLQKDFEHLLVKTTPLPFGDVDKLRDTIRKLGADNIVCVILEPIQGEAGCILPPPGFLQGVGELCREKGITVIADEIQTGLGRTGHWFESIAGGLEPDIICLAKPLGGGMVAIGATLVRDKIFQKMLGKVNDVKRHSNTFGGNSLAMAVGLKSLELVMDQNLPERSLRMGKIGLERLQIMAKRYPKLFKEVRGAGMLMAMSFHPVVRSSLLHSQAALINEVTGLFALKTFYDGGVQLNFSLNSAFTLRLTPAMNIPESLFDELFVRLERSADQTRSSFKTFSRTPLSSLTKLLGYMVKNG